MCLVPANTASRACVWLPHDRVRGCRGLALALMGASRPIPGATIDKPPDPCAHGCRNLTLLGKWWGFCSMRSLATACRRRVAPLLVQFPPFAGGKVAVRGGVAPHRRPPRRKTLTMGGVGESACGVVDTTAPDLAWSAHANQLLRALTSYLARKPAVQCLGGAAHARISGPTCELAGPRACHRAHVLGKRFRVSAPRFQATSTGMRLID